jgi:uncharacterized protein YacL
MTNVVEIVLLLVIIGLLLRGSKFSFSMGKAAAHKVILDSSGLIDGRILELVRANFLSDQLILPQFILNELQLLADGQDTYKRERARFGLDVAHELQNISETAVVISRTRLSEIHTTDDKLVALSKKQHARLYTTDYNLAKVAAIESIQVVNVNELAQQLRPVSLPGEKVSVKVLQKGSSPDQGVGYLEDGTMIVIDGGAKAVGKLVEVSVDRMHQTLAGKMVFAHLSLLPRARDQSRNRRAATLPESAAHKLQQRLQNRR